MTRYYHLEPEAFDRMTGREIHEYVTTLDQAVEAGWGMVSDGR